MDAVEELLMSKADDRKELQKKLVDLKAHLKEVTDFAEAHQLEFNFLGMKFFLKDPGGSKRYAPKGIFINESQWESSTWGCTDSEESERFDEWENKYFPYDEDAELDDETEEDDG